MTTSTTASGRRAARVPDDARRSAPPAPPARSVADELFDEPPPAGGAATDLPPEPDDIPPPPDPAVKPPVTTVEAAYPLLRAPFPPRLVELKPGAMTKDRTRALGMPYVDMRAYQRRLDQVVGSWGWEVEYVASDRALICRLTVLGVTKSALGDYPIDRTDENPATSAEAQAFKRACAAFGLGRYLYALPQVWANYDPDRKHIIDPQGVVRQMYEMAGL